MIYLTFVLIASARVQIPLAKRRKYLFHSPFTKNKTNRYGWFCFLVTGADFVRHALRGYEPERTALRVNNLRPKRKRLSIVFTTVDTTKQGVGRAECIEAIGEDYATCANGREVQIPSPPLTPREIILWDYFFTLRFS